MKRKRLALIAIYPLRVLAGNTAITYSASATCVTITETTGPTCPTLAGHCVRPECIEVSTITQECGCASIFSTTSCETVCGHGCGTSYDTVYLPCATSIPSPAPVTTTTSTASSYPPTAPSSSTVTVIPPPTIYPNSTITAPSTSTSTSTSIITITSCPASVTCTGQTTTWSGSSGPSVCPVNTSCSRVLPGSSVSTGGGGGLETVTSVAVLTSRKTGPSPTASASVTQVQGNAGASMRGFGAVEGGVLIGLIGAVVGMI